MSIVCICGFRETAQLEERRWREATANESVGDGIREPSRGTMTDSREAADKLSSLQQ